MRNTENPRPSPLLLTLVTIGMLWVGWGLHAGKPNILLIMADDMGAEALSCYGSLSCTTPRLDQLAAGGIRFTHGYSQPLCTPSRVQIMTGQYNFRNYEDFGYLKPDQVTFAHKAREAGYATCIAGKWQLNGLSYDKPGFDRPERAREAGFDEYCLWQLTQPKSKGERYANPLIEKNGQILERNPDSYGPDVFCDFLIDFMERHKEVPFLAYYPMVLTHDPFVPTPFSAEWEGDRYGKDPKFFVDMVAHTDRIVGRLLDALERLGLRDNTLILFTGDNGTHVSITTQTKNGPVQGGKGTTLDTGIHVPFIAQWPGVTHEKAVYMDLIDFSDIYPTLCDVMGVDPTPGKVVDGKSFLSRLQGKPGVIRDHVFFHYDPRWGNREKWRSRFVRDHRFKLYHDGRMFEPDKDPFEESPLTKDVGNKEVSLARFRLQAALDAMPPWEMEK